MLECIKNCEKIWIKSKIVKIAWESRKKQNMIKKMKNCEIVLLTKGENVLKKSKNFENVVKIRQVVKYTENAHME